MTFARHTRFGWTARTQTTSKHTSQPPSQRTASAAPVRSLHGPVVAAAQHFELPRILSQKLVAADESAGAAQRVPPGLPQELLEVTIPFGPVALELEPVPAVPSPRLEEGRPTGENGGGSHGFRFQSPSKHGVVQFVACLWFPCGFLIPSSIGGFILRVPAPGPPMDRLLFSAEIIHSNAVRQEKTGEGIGPAWI